MSERFDFEHLIRETLKKQHLGIEVTHFRKEPTIDSQFRPDADMKIGHDTVLIEVKRSIEPQSIKGLTERYMPQQQSVLVVAEYISPKAKQLLIEKGFNYLDTAGNIFLKLPNLKIRDEGHKTSPISENYRNRAFTKAGMSVVFQLLMDKQAINDTQRSLSHKSGVSLGTIPKVLEQLTKDGYVVNLNEHQKALINLEELLKRWVSTARERLFKPEMETHYQPLGQTPTEVFKATEFDGDALWAGEPGAAQLTSYLRPETFVLYTSLSDRELLKKYKFQKKFEGKLVVRQPFWNYAPATGKHVHPILIYAELVSSGDGRNLEVAEMIYNEHISKNL